jgi:hypothetical protein
VLYPRDADTVLTFNAALGDSFQGKPVGVRWLNGPGKAVCFGFPLYYTVESEAFVLARKVLDDLGEPYGVSEMTNADVRTMRLPTVIRGILFLPPSLLSPPSSLLSVDGRCVMSLLPGANDVRGLAPGVYFIRPEPSAAGREPSTITKVVLTR